MTVPETQRRTVQVKLRLRPEAAAALRALAEKHGTSVSEVVAILVGSPGPDGGSDKSTGTP